MMPSEIPIDDYNFSSEGYYFTNQNQFDCFYLNSHLISINLKNYPEEKIKKLFEYNFGSNA